MGSYTTENGKSIKANLQHFFQNDLHIEYLHPGIYRSDSGPLSLAISPCVGAMSTGDGFDQICMEETAPLKLPPYGALQINL